MHLGPKKKNKFAVNFVRRKINGIYFIRIEMSQCERGLRFAMLAGCRLMIMHV